MDEHGARRAVCDPSREDCAGTAAARGGETARGRAEARAPQDEASQACGEGAAHVQGIGGRRRGRDEVEGGTVCLASGREQGSEAGCTQHSSARLEPRSSAWLERLDVSASASAGSAPAASSGAAVFTASTIATASVAVTSVSAAAFGASTSTAAWYDGVEYYHHLGHDEHHKHDDVDHDDHGVAAADYGDDDDACAVRLRASSRARTESKQECPAPEQI
jgi:hypothetical protein